MLCLAVQGESIIIDVSILVVDLQNHVLILLASTRAMVNVNDGTIGEHSSVNSPKTSYA